MAFLHQMDAQIIAGWLLDSRSAHQLIDRAVDLLIESGFDYLVAEFERV